MTTPEDDVAVVEDSPRRPEDTGPRSGTRPAPLTGSARSC